MHRGSACGGCAYTWQIYQIYQQWSPDVERGVFIYQEEKGHVYRWKVSQVWLSMLLIVKNANTNFKCQNESFYSCTWPRERQRCDFAKLQREVESRRFCVHSPKMKLCFWNPLRWDIWVVSRKMRGYFSVNQKPSIFRGDIFLDVEICRRWSCYLLLQPLLLLLLSMIVVVKLRQVTFYSKQSNAK